MTESTAPINNTTLQRIDTLIIKLNGLAHGLDPISNLFPNIAPKLHTAESLLDIAENFIEGLENTPLVDGASIAAHQISISTGDPQLDARLSVLDMHVQEVAPLLPLIRLALKKLGVE